MAHNSQIRGVVLTALFAVCIALLWLDGMNSPGNSPGMRQASQQEDNNPEKFYLVATKSSYTYSFTYDPLAQDQWLFRTGDGSTLGEPFLRP